MAYFTSASFPMWRLMRGTAYSWGTFADSLSSSTSLSLLLLSSCPSRWAFFYLMISNTICFRCAFSLRVFSCCAYCHVVHSRYLFFRVPCFRCMCWFLLYSVASLHRFFGVACFLVSFLMLRILLFYVACSHFLFLLHFGILRFVALRSSYVRSITLCLVTVFRISHSVTLCSSF